MNTIFMGFDPRERAAYDVAHASIFRRTDRSNTVIHPLKLSELSHILTRPIDRMDGKLWCPISQAPMATEFAISRFCVPFLTNGWALFMDCDMLVLDDIAKLFALADEKYAVMVVKHQQDSGVATKMDGQVQTYYSRKNWSSVILWNCSHRAHGRLSASDLNTWPGRDLHAFKWLYDNEIGELPNEWNHLVGVNPAPNKPPKILHYTLGGPWFSGWKGGPFDETWSEEHAHTMIGVKHD